MNHLGLFEGIGGFSLAARWMGWKTIAWCEWNPFCQKVLSHHFPEADALHDITKTDFTKYHGTVDIITGGFPCQPYSLAGKQKGTEDERHLWPHMLRVIRQVEPRWVIGENVPGLVNWNDGLVFEQVQADLEACGYEVIPFNVPAAGVNAPHRRERIWFVAFRADVRTGHVANPINIGTGDKSGQISDQGRLTCQDRRTCLRQDNWQAGTGGHNTTGSHGLIKNTLQDGWGSEQRQEESEERGQRNTGTGDNEQLRTNDAETGAVADSTNTGLKNLQCAGKDGVHGLENATHTSSSGRLQNNQEQSSEQSECSIPGWRHFPTQSPVCNGDDGLSARLDADAFSKGISKKGIHTLKSDGQVIAELVEKYPKLTFAKWRAESIKAGGNAIVPQVALQFYQAIALFEEQLKQEIEP